MAAVVSEYYWVEGKGGEEMALNKMGPPSACCCVCLLVCGGVTKSLRRKWFWGFDFANRQLIPRTKLSWPEAACLQHSQLRHTRRRPNPYGRFANATHTHSTSARSSASNSCMSVGAVDAISTGSAGWKENNLRLDVATWAASFSETEALQPN